MVGGFEFIDGICADSSGDIYFCDSRWKRIYKWSAKENSLALLTEIPYKPLTLAFDTEDNLLIVIEYSPAKGATIGGELEIYPKPEDSRGTSHGYWYSVNSTTKVISIDPNKPDTSIQVLEQADIDSVKRYTRPCMGKQVEGRTRLPGGLCKQTGQCFVHLME